MPIPLDPVAFTIFGFEIRWYGVLITGAIILGIFLALRELRRLGEDEDKFIDMLLLVIPAAIVGARLYYVLFSGQLDWYLARPLRILQFRSGGLAIHGSLIAGALVAWLYTRRNKVSFFRWADVIAPSVILGQAIGRWGNFFNQEAYGRETALPWAMYIDGAYRHPTFLYESLWNLGVFAFLLWQRRRTKFEGEVLLWYLVLYSVGRFFIEGLRTDSLYLGPFRIAQLVSLASVVIGAVLLYRGRRRGTPTL
ncbi:MAG: prolipoprotein diacylglyceryl transferase [Bacillota bacterium]